MGVGWVGNLSRCYFKGHRVLPRAEDPCDQALKECAARSLVVCRREFWAENLAQAKAQRPECSVYLM